MEHRISHRCQKWANSPIAAGGKGDIQVFWGFVYKYTRMVDTECCVWELRCGSGGRMLWPAWGKLYIPSPTLPPYKPSTGVAQANNTNTQELEAEGSEMIKMTSRYIVTLSQRRATHRGEWACMLCMLHFIKDWCIALEKWHLGSWEYYLTVSVFYSHNIATFILILLL